MATIARALLSALPVSMLVLLASACASQPDPQHRQPCPEDQPDACTMEYAPVIGYSTEGKDRGVFSNHCSACREDNVDYTVPKEHAD